MRPRRVNLVHVVVGRSTGFASQVLPVGQVERVRLFCRQCAGLADNLVEVLDIVVTPRIAMLIVRHAPGNPDRLAAQAVQQPRQCAVIATGGLVLHVEDRLTPQQLLVADVALYAR
ncbi:hypothetical protein D3C77_362750 [compost metagenome]